MKLIAALLLLLLSVIPGDTQTMGFGTGTPLYAPNALCFLSADSSTTRNSNYTGLVDGKLGIVSFWYMSDQAGLPHVAGGVQGSFVEFLHDSSGGWTIILLKIGGGDAIGSYSSIALGHNGDNIWHHFMASWDSNVACNTHMYVDGVDSLSGPTVCDQAADIDYTRTQHFYSSIGGGSQNWSGGLADMYVNYDEYIDLSILANRRKFISAANEPVFLGADGSAPTGTAPLGYLKNVAATANVNSGTGGNHGAILNITDCVLAGPLKVGSN